MFIGEVSLHPTVGSGFLRIETIQSWHGVYQQMLSMDISMKVSYNKTNAILPKFQPSLSTFRRFRNIEAFCLDQIVWGKLYYISKDIIFSVILQNGV